MRNRAIKPVPPVSTVGTAKGTTTHVMPYPIKNDVQAPVWFAWGKRDAKAHAFLVPSGFLEAPSKVRGKVVTVCKRTVDAHRLDYGDANRGRCKTCTTALAEDTRKRGTGLSEPTVAPVDTGVQHGDPKAAELRRVAELAPISGEAAKDNAEIVSTLRAGNKGEALSLARDLDERGPAASVPEADRAPIGSRDHGTLDGVAMVQGPNMDASDGGVTNWTRKVHPEDLPNALKGAPMVESNPDAKRRTWRNPATGETEPAAARLDGSLRERIDREVVPPTRARRSKASRRRYRKNQQTERNVAARFKARGESMPSKGKGLPTVSQEVKRLRALGRDLPKAGW